MTLLELLMFAGLLGVESGHWFAVIDPPKELLQNLDFFSQVDMIEHMDLMEYAPADKSNQRSGAGR